MSSPLSGLIAALLLSAGTHLAWADPAPFDLAGPHLSVTVTRGGESLPISQVPNLAVGRSTDDSRGSAGKPVRSAT